jgi:hypothetical protein
MSYGSNDGRSRMDDDSRGYQSQYRNGDTSGYSRDNSRNKQSAYSRDRKNEIYQEEQSREEDMASKIRENEKKHKKMMLENLKRKKRKERELSVKKEKSEAQEAKVLSNRKKEIDQGCQKYLRDNFKEVFQAPNPETSFRSTSQTNPSRSSTQNDSHYSNNYNDISRISNRNSHYNYQSPLNSNSNSTNLPPPRPISKTRPHLASNNTQQRPQKLSRQNSNAYNTAINPNDYSGTPNYYKQGSTNYLDDSFNKLNSKKQNDGKWEKPYAHDMEDLNNLNMEFSQTFEKMEKLIMGGGGTGLGQGQGGLDLGGKKNSLAEGERGYGYLEKNKENNSFGGNSGNHRENSANHRDNSANHRDNSYSEQDSLCNGDRSGYDHLIKKIVPREQALELLRDVLESQDFKESAMSGEDRQNLGGRENFDNDYRQDMDDVFGNDKQGYTAKN